MHVHDIVCQTRRAIGPVPATQAVTSKVPHPAGQVSEGIKTPSSVQRENMIKAKIRALFHELECLLNIGRLNTPEEIFVQSKLLLVMFWELHKLIKQLRDVVCVLLQ